MKKLFSILFVLGALLISVNGVFASVKPEPKEPVCVEGQVSIENDVEFEHHRNTYRWHIVGQTETEVTYQLQEREFGWYFENGWKYGWHWENRDETRTFKVPTCLTTPICNDPGGANYDPTIDPGEYHDASMCTPQTFNHEGSVGANICQGVPFVLLPGNVLVKRAGDSATVQWIPTQGNKAHIYYHEVQNPSNAHAVIETDNDGIETINFLGKKDWTFSVQQLDGCAASGLVSVVDGAGYKLFSLPAYSVVTGLPL